MHSEQTEARTRLGLGSWRNRGVNGRGRSSGSNRGIDYSSGSSARVSRGVKAKETTKFVWSVLSVGLITTFMSKGAMWHDFSFLDKRKGKKKRMWG